MGQPVHLCEGRGGGQALGGGLFVGVHQAGAEADGWFFLMGLLLHLAGVVEAEHGGLAFAPPPEMKEGGLAAAHAEALGVALLLQGLARGSAWTGRGELGRRLAGLALGLIGEAVLAADEPVGLAVIFPRLDDVFEAMVGELAGPGAALVPHGGLATRDAEAGGVPGLPVGALLGQMGGAKGGGLTLPCAGGVNEGRLAALDAAALLTEFCHRGRASWAGGRGGRWGAGRRRPRVWPCAAAPCAARTYWRSALAGGHRDR